MLNRLLDDNRELLIPETQETVKPHAHFMLFATQNPAGGAYGGRKMMSRAFRNRFLEVHVDDIPHEELKEMIEKRCKIPPSRAEKIVAVMQELHRRRQRSNVFAGRHAFVTPRDLFKWADRLAAAPSDCQKLMAQEGFMLLAEGLRRQEEKDAVQQVLQKIVKVTIDVPALYAGGWEDDVAAMLAGRPAAPSGETLALGGAFSELVHTKSAKRLLRLVARCMRFKEPVLLVGETGTGKTTVCQAFAAALGNKLHIVNCHQNSETSDLIGGFRPGNTHTHTHKHTHTHTHTQTHTHYITSSWQRRSDCTFPFPPQSLLRAHASKLGGSAGQPGRHGNRPAPGGA
jgi:midasin (ATPase involved in ribosome maturation)